MKFTISKSAWLRGESSNSMLLRPSDGKMCCLGFRALACGYTTEDISLKCTPATLVDTSLRFGECFVTTTKSCSPLVISDLCRELIGVNDSDQMSDEDRITKLTKLFASIGDEVTFVD